MTNVSSTGASGLSPYTINPDGTLAAITTGTFATGSGPKGIAISPNGNYLYVTNDGGSISAYTITSGSGALASNGTFTTVTNPQGGIAISPNGNYLYVTNVSSSGTNGLSAYAINSGGSLSLSSSGYTTGATPFGIAISPDGNYLYVTNIGSATGASGISAFRINSDGTLFPITLTASRLYHRKIPCRDSHRAVKGRESRCGALSSSRQGERTQNLREVATFIWNKWAMRNSNARPMAPEAIALSN